MAVEYGANIYYNGNCEIPCDDQCTPTIMLSQRQVSANGGKAEHGIVVSTQCEESENK